MKDRLPLVADLLMDAAHADSALEGTEKAAVKRQGAWPGVHVRLAGLPPSGHRRDQNEGTTHCEPRDSARHPAHAPFYHFV